MKPRPYSNLFSFCQMPFFCSRIPHYIYLSCFLMLLLAVTLAQTSLVLVTLRVLRKLVRYLWYSPQLDLSDVFSWLDRGYGLWTFGRKTREVKCHFFIMSYQGYIPLLWPITADVDIGHLADVVFQISPHSYSLPAFYTELSAKKSLCAAHSQRVRSYTLPPCGQSIYRNYLEFFLHRFVSSPCLLIYLISYLYHPVTSAYM